MMVELIKTLTEKKCLTRRRLDFKEHKKCSQDNEIILKSFKRFKSEVHNVFTEEVNKVAINSNDDKKLQTFDEMKLYHIHITQVQEKCAHQKCCNI